MKKKAQRKTQVIDSGNSVAAMFNRIAGLNNNAANLSFYNAVGLKVPTNFFPGNGSITKLTRVPSIMAIGCIPNPGYSPDGSSAVNVAARGIVAYLTSTIGRPYNYDENDFLLYLMCYASARNHLVILHRSIREAMLVSGENRAVPDLLIRAGGFDASDFVTNLAQARFLYNYYANQLLKLNVPNTFNFFDWQAHLFSNVWRDQDNLKAQLYLIYPEVYYVYDETNNQATASKYAGNLNLAGWKTIMDTMLNALLESQTIGNMSSDVKKAFEDGQLVAIPTLNNDEVLTPIKDSGMLNFIHNMTLVGSVNDPSATTWASLNIGLTNITESGQYLIYTPTATILNSSQLNTNIEGCITSTLALDMPYDNPTADDVLVATRGKATIPVTTGSSTAQISGSGTEIYTHADIWSVGLGDGLLQFPVRYTSAVPVLSSNTGAYLLPRISLISMFDWAPKFAFYIYTNSSGTYTVTGAAQLWEVNNYTTLTSDVLNRINDGALASVYNIPQIGVVGK